MYHNVSNCFVKTVLHVVCISFSVLPKLVLFLVFIPACVQMASTNCRHFMNFGKNEIHRTLSCGIVPCNVHINLFLFSYKF
uniref:Uncharacterized protein n=1 Tax=Anguilla anguilla TaxID=7936 RepID=A0A0E9WWK9_ANGAN